MRESQIGENNTGVGGTKMVQKSVAGVLKKEPVKQVQKGVAGVIAKPPVKSAQKGVAGVISKPTNVRNGSGLLAARKRAIAAR